MTNTEIQVGEYVRTKMFGIGKVTYKDKNLITYNTGKSSITEKYEGQNHSFNLIDLIEVGDYVNGSFIIRAAKDCVDDEGTPIILTEEYDDWSDNGVIYNKDIKTIVTKEQFKSMEYEVIENE